MGDCMDDFEPHQLGMWCTRVEGTGSCMHGFSLWEHETQKISAGGSANKLRIRKQKEGFHRWKIQALFFLSLLTMS